MHTAGVTAADLVYDRLVADEKLKTGSKYERLAALIYKVMLANADVVHHVILRAGDKEAKHEIDVSVTVGGQPRMLLIECRDRGRKVTIGEVRDFHGKLHQLQPDAGVMLSPAGFTRGAVAFAKDEGIELAVFRPVSSDDSWVETVKIEMHLSVPGLPTISDVEWVDGEGARLAAVLGGRSISLDVYSDVLAADGQPRGLLRELMEEAMKSAMPSGFGAAHIEDEMRFDPPVQIAFSGMYAGVRGLRFNFDVEEALQTMTVSASGVAEMLLHRVTGAGAGGGRVFFDEHFRALGFDERGRVVAKNRGRRP
jgi:hypothetical protein